MKIQPGLNEDLKPRVVNVDQMLRSALPELIVTTKSDRVTFFFAISHLAQGCRDQEGGEQERSGGRLQAGSTFFY